MPLIDIKASVERRDGTVLATYARRVDVMKLSIARSWLTRAFNKALREAERDIIIDARYFGQLKVPPYTSYSGGMSGLNGQITRREGTYD